MSEQEDLVGREAKHGEKMIWLNVGFWTDGIAPEAGKVIPKRAWGRGWFACKRMSPMGLIQGRRCHSTLCQNSSQRSKIF
jgi:hypothetical protein